MKLPAVIITYATLAFLSGIIDLVSAVWLLFANPWNAFGDIMAELFWGLFSLCLGFGILRLRPAWRIVALVCCWIVFIIFAFSLVCWCVRPESVRITYLVILGATAGLNLWFYLAFRSDEIRSLFLGRVTHRYEVHL